MNNLEQQIVKMVRQDLSDDEILKLVRRDLIDGAPLVREPRRKAKKARQAPAKMRAAAVDTGQAKKKKRRKAKQNRTPKNEMSPDETKALKVIQKSRMPVSVKQVAAKLKLGIGPAKTAVDRLLDKKLVTKDGDIPPGGKRPKMWFYAAV